METELRNHLEVRDFDAEPVPLCQGRIRFIKSNQEGDEEPEWMFEGIASDETEDEEGDKVLGKSLDLSYASERGFVNWNHSRNPEDQLGFLEEAKLLQPDDLKELSERWGIQLSKSATVFVRGRLYKHVDKAQKVMNILKSLEAGIDRGPGLSLDGVLARDEETRDVVRAYVRGIAITPSPAQPKTFCMLKKSLLRFNELQNQDGVLTRNQAILHVLQLRPNWNLDIARKFLSYVEEG